jgi:hypothetical protein
MGQVEAYIDRAERGAYQFASCGSLLGEDAAIEQIARGRLEAYRARIWRAIYPSSREVFPPGAARRKDVRPPRRAAAWARRFLARRSEPLPCERRCGMGKSPRAVAGMRSCW